MNDMNTPLGFSFTFLHTLQASACRILSCSVQLSLPHTMGVNNSHILPWGTLIE